MNRQDKDVSEERRGPRQKKSLYPGVKPSPHGGHEDSYPLHPDAT